MNTRPRMIEGPVGRSILGLTLPMMVGTFSAMVFNLVDTWYVSRLGTGPLAALAFTFPVVMAVASIAFGLGTGLSSAVSRAIGEGRPERVRRLTTDGLLLAFLVALALSVGGLLGMKPLFAALGARGELLEQVGRYMGVWFSGAAFALVPMVGNNAIRATGDTRTPAMVMMVAAGINVVLDPLLIFGWGPFPRMELAGAALATVIARMLTMVVALWVLGKREHMLCRRLPSPRELWESWRSILSIAAPAAAMHLLVPLSIAVITRIAAEFGPAVVAAVGAGGRVEAFALMPFMAMSAILVPFMGQNLGAGCLVRLRQARAFVFRFAVAWGLGASLMLAVAAPAIASLFSDDPAVVSSLALYMRIVPIGFALQGVSMLGNALFNGVGRPLHATALMALRVLALLVPLVWLGARWFEYRGVLGGLVLTNLLAGSIAWYWTRRAVAETAAESDARATIASVSSPSYPATTPSG